MTDFLHAWLARSPFIAILRGITPDEAVPAGEALWDAGWRILEVPLNSPAAFDSIERLQRRFGDQMLIGAGTVRRAEEVRTLAAIGAKLMVCPHTDPNLIATAKAADLIALPGAATASECLRALDAGADGLKLFPADALGTQTLRALRAVLPVDTLVLPVGSIAPDNLAAWRAAGATGFGVGGALYQPEQTPTRLSEIALKFNAAWTTTNRARPADLTSPRKM